MAASTLFIKRVSSSSSTLNNFFKLVNPVFIPSASRSYITGTLYLNDDGNVERRSCRCRFTRCSGCNCSEFWGLNPKVGKLVISDFMASPRGEVGSEREKRGLGWGFREDKEAVYLKLAMPGMGKDDVKITLENNSIVIKGEAAKDGDDDETNYRVSGGVSFPPDGCDIDSIRAEMKNGVLKVTFPKAKDNVRHIPIQ